MIKFIFLSALFFSLSVSAAPADEKIDILIVTNVGAQVIHMAEIKDGRLTFDGVKLNATMALNYGPQLWKLRPQEEPLIRFSCSAGTVRIQSLKKGNSRAETTCMESERGQSILKALQNLTWLSRLN